MLARFQAPAGPLPLAPATRRARPPSERRLHRSLGVLLSIAAAAVPARGQGRGIDALLEDFCSVHRHHAVVEQVRTWPLASRVEFARRVIAEDEDHSWVRVAAYRLAGLAESRELSEAQAELLRAGLADPMAENRLHCAQAAPRLPAEEQAAVVPALIGLLVDDSPVVRAASAGVLGALGDDARQALPALAAGVVDPDESGDGPWSVAYWDARRAEYGLDGPFGDVEVLVRTACFHARMGLAGSTTDLALFPEMDARGREALMLAYGRHLTWVAVDPEQQVDPAAVRSFLDPITQYAFDRRSSPETRLQLARGLASLTVEGEVDAEVLALLDRLCSFEEDPDVLAQMSVLRDEARRR